MNQAENNRLEYKEKLTDDLEKEVVAFLNSKGGDIYIGLKDDGTVMGVNNSNEVQLKIKDRLINNIRPGIMGLFDIIAKEQDGKVIIIVNLAGGTEIPYYIKQKGRSESGCFIRIGSSAQPMTEDMIAGYMAQRHSVSLANMLSRHQDLKFIQLKIFYEGKKKNLNEHFIQSLDFLTKDGKYNQLAYLFADVNRVSIRVGKYAGTDKLDLSENEEYGDCSLLKAMQKVLDRLEMENITQARKRGLKPRLEKKLVDKDAMREAVINAFAHNDYSSGDTPIFEIFSDRFEITSYGGLVTGLSKEEFFTGVSRPRNREIMRIFKDLELVEQLGSGMPLIVEKFGRDSFQFFTSAIRVTLKFDRELGDEVKTTQKTTQKILEAIRKQPQITRRELAELAGISPNTIKEHLQRLKEQGFIRRIGPDKGGYWEISD